MTYTLKQIYSFHNDGSSKVKAFIKVKEFTVKALTSTTKLYYGIVNVDVFERDYKISKEDYLLLYDKFGKDKCSIEEIKVLLRNRKLIKI